MTALIETVRIRGGRAPLWQLHLRRLSRSCQALRIPIPPLLREPGGGVDRVHRFEVGPKGFTLAERQVPSPAPVRLVTVPTVHPGYSHKTTARDAFVQAEQAAMRSGGNAPLLLTSRGLVAEGAIWCLYWWEGDRIAGPALELGILEGVSRMRIEEMTGPILERKVRLKELAGRPIFLSNAVRGIIEPETLDSGAVPRHSGTEGLREAFWP